MTYDQSRGPSLSARLGMTATASPKLTDHIMYRAHFVRHLLELVEREGLRAIGKRFFRFAMHFDHQTIGADRNSGTSQRRNHVVFAGAVRGINDYRQMRNPSYRRHGSKIEGVAGVLSEGADTAFAKNDLVIAFRHNVLGRKQPFLQRRGHPSLEQHRQL